MGFLQSIFPDYFTSYEKESDTKKDAFGKGTLERYNECIGEDIDLEIQPVIDDLVKNTIDPRDNWDRFIPYVEKQMGVNVTLEATLTMRRAVNQVLQRITTIKGTKKALEVLFGMIGISIVLTEHFNEGGFDSALTFDDDIRVFDSGHCPTCSEYSLALTGSAVLGTTLTWIIGNIIDWNEPINATIRTLTYNGTPITAGDFAAADFNVDFFT